MATHSGILAWKIPWTKEFGGLQSMGSQRVRQDRVMNTFTFTTFKWDSQSKDVGHSPCLEGGNWVSASVFQVKLIQEQSPFDGRCPVTCHPFLLHLLG